MTGRHLNAFAVHGPADIRRANAATVYRLLSDSGPATRAQLAQRSGLTVPTVTSIVNDLSVDGFVDQQRGEGPRGSGRPGLVVHPRPRARTLAVVNHRQGRLQVMITDLRGEPLAVRSCAPLRVSDPWQAFADTVVRETVELHAAAESGPLAAMSLALPGSIDPHSGTWTFQQRAGWRDVPLQTALQDAVGVPVTAVKIMDAAVVGELARRPDLPHPVVLVYVGKGVGSAAAIDGRLVRGVRGSAGEFGHCTLPGVTARCGCGRIGCLEAVTSAGYLRRQVRRITGYRAPATAAGLYELGIAAVDELLGVSAARLGLAASWLVNVINPALVLLGGGPFLDSPAFFDDFERSLRRHAFATNRRELRVEAAATDAAVAGAVRAARELLPGPLRPAREIVASL